MPTVPKRDSRPRRTSEKYGARGLVVIGISLDDEPQAVGPVVESLNIAYPIVCGNPGVAMAYGDVEAVPSTFVINREGKITALHEGRAEASAIEAEIKPLF